MHEEQKKEIERESSVIGRDANLREMRNYKTKDKYRRYTERLNNTHDIVFNSISDYFFLRFGDRQIIETILKQDVFFMYDQL